MGLIAFGLGPAAAIWAAAASPGAEERAAVKAGVSVIVSGGAMMNGDLFNAAVSPAMRLHYAGCRRIALVLHASHPTDYVRIEKRLVKAFAALNGATAESLHHRDAAGQRQMLEQADGIFVGGGETFVLLRTLYETGQLDLIRARVQAGVPYGGSSAGANVAGLLIGTTNDFPVTDIPTRRALALFPAVINPHHPVPEETNDYAGRVNKIKIYLKFNADEAVLGLANAALVRYHAGQIKVAAGTAWLYRASGVRALQVGDELPELLATR